MLDLNLKKYKSDGFVIFKKGITENLLLRFHRDIEKLLLSKFPKFSKLFKDQKINIRVPKLLSLAESDNPDKFYQVCIDCKKLASFSMIDISDEFKEFLLFLLENDPNKVFTIGTNGIFINKKNVKRLKYEWHQEKSYYPFHKHGIHLWFPLFNDIELTGGPMLLKKNTHTRDFKYEKIEQEKALLQKKISEEDLRKYEIFECNLELGDVIIFDHGLVHCTKEVFTQEIPRISGIKRYIAF